jgi:Holliday junction resolvase
VRCGGFTVSALKALIESKSTEAQSIRVKREWLRKITDEALQMGRVPALALTIQDEQWLAIPLFYVDWEGK